MSKLSTNVAPIDRVFCRKVTVMQKKGIRRHLIPVWKSPGGGQLSMAGDHRICVGVLQSL